MSYTNTANTANSIVGNIISTATTNVTDPIAIVTNAITNNNTKPILDIGLTDLVKKIDQDNKLKLYVTYEKDTNGELNIKDQYYIDKTDPNASVVKKVKVEVNA